MAALLRVQVDNPEELLVLFSAGALISWEHSADASSWSAGGTEAIVAGTTVYTIEHLAGTDATYYRTRYSNSGGTSFSAYTDAFRPGAPQAYATLHDVTETMQLGTSTGHHNLLLDMLGDVSRDVDTHTFRTFLRVPQVTGTETFYLDVHRSHRSLSIAAGDHCTDGRALDIISITTLEVRDSESGSYVEVAAGDTGYYLQPGYGPGIAGTDWPYEDVLLSPAGSRVCWPVGHRAVRIVGVRGFPRIPGPVKRAVISEVRERFRQSIGGGPTQAGVNQFGTPIYVTGSTQEFRMLMKHPYRKGFGIA